jgi:hypothetical protein
MDFSPCVLPSDAPEADAECCLAVSSLRLNEAVSDKLFEPQLSEGTLAIDFSRNQSWTVGPSGEQIGRQYFGSASSN